MIDQALGKHYGVHPCVLFRLLYKKNVAVCYKLLIYGNKSDQNRTKFALTNAYN